MAAALDAFRRDREHAAFWREPVLGAQCLIRGDDHKAGDTGGARGGGRQSRRRQQCNGGAKVVLVDKDGPLGASLERELDTAAEVDVGQVALATVLEWQEFRGLPSIRPDHPRLSDWLDAFTARPSMRATPLLGETHDAA